MEVSSGGLAEVVVSLPRLDDQRNIGDHLDGEVGRLTELIQLRRVQVDSLRELERSRVDSVLAAQGDVSLVRLGYLSIVQSGVTVDAGRRVDTTFVRRPYLRVANVQNGHIDLTEVSSIMVSPRIAFEGRLRFGDVLMTEGGDLDKLGRGAVWRGQIDDCLHQNHVFAVRANRESLNPDYLATVTRSSLAREYFERTGNKTTNLASTSSSKIKDFRVPLPDLEVQRASVRQIDVHSAEIQAARAALGRQIELLEERRHALIVAAVTGQVDVTTARGADV